MSDVSTEVTFVAEDDPQPNSIAVTIYVGDAYVTVTATGWTDALQAIKAFYLIGRREILDELCGSIADAVDEPVTE